MRAKGYLCLRMIYREIHTFFWIEWERDWRNKTLLYANAFFPLLAVTIVSNTFSKLSYQSWNALFWLIFLFASITIAAKSFLSDSPQRKLYMYSLGSGVSIWIAKWLYHMLLLCVVMLLNFLFLTFMEDGNPIYMGGNPIFNIALFSFSGIIGASYFSLILSLVSAMITHTNKSAGLLSAIAIPLLIPMLIILSELSLKSMLGSMSFLANIKTIGVVVGMHILLFIIGLILFPALWKE